MEEGAVAPDAAADAAAGEGAPAAAAVAAEAAVPPAPVLPEPIVFHRGDFSFNRRFFETKLAAFFRVVPGETGEGPCIARSRPCGRSTIGKRISRITPEELYLEVVNNNASADEMIPLVEITEVQIRHKDLP